jgi:hypothetical protein
MNNDKNDCADLFPMPSNHLGPNHRSSVFNNRTERLPGPSGSVEAIRVIVVIVVHPR